MKKQLTGKKNCEQRLTLSTRTRKNLMYGYQNLFYSQCHLISLFAHKTSFDKAVGFCPLFLHLRGARKGG